MGFVGWFLNALLLLKIIVSMKRCYVGILGNIEKCINFAGVFLKRLKFKKDIRDGLGWVCLKHTTLRELGNI